MQQSHQSIVGLYCQSTKTSSVVAVQGVVEDQQHASSQQELCSYFADTRIVYERLVSYVRAQIGEPFSDNELALLRDERFGFVRDSHRGGDRAKRGVDAVNLAGCLRNDLVAQRLVGRALYLYGGENQNVSSSSGEKAGKKYDNTVVYRHRWEPNTVVFWDSAKVMLLEGEHDLGGVPNSVTTRDEGEEGEGSCCMEVDGDAAQQVENTEKAPLVMWQAVCRL